MNMKSILVAGIVALASAAPALALDVGPYHIKSGTVIGRGPWVPYAGPKDGTPNDFRKFVYRKTGVRLGACVSQGKESIDGLSYGGLRGKTCTAWHIVEGYGPHKTGDIMMLPPRKPSLMEYLQAKK